MKHLILLSLVCLSTCGLSATYQTYTPHSKNYSGNNQQSDYEARSLQNQERAVQNQERELSQQQSSQSRVRQIQL